MKQSGTTDIRLRTRAKAGVRWWTMLLSMGLAASLCPGCRRAGAGSDNPALERYKQAGHRIEAAVTTIDVALSAPRTTLATAGLAAKRTAPATPPPPAEEEAQAIPFRVTGILANESAPLVLTSAGTAGVGEEVNGFKVVEIGEDVVTFANSRGHRTKVSLYKDGAGP